MKPDREAPGALPADPFATLPPAEGIQRSHREALSPPLRTSRASVAVAAFIPRHALPPPHAFLFRDDGVEAQPRWLAEALALNRFRVLHGLRVDWAMAPSDGVMSPTDVRNLRVVNPTRVRPLFDKRFAARMEVAPNPGSMLPPPPGHALPNAIVGVGERLRAVNGVLDTPLGRVFGRARAAVMDWRHATQASELPSVGSSMQLWAADDGCRALVAIHNAFPRYTYYLDGRQVEWGDPPSPTRRLFDGHAVEAEWQPTIALALYNAMRDYPLPARYPGGCTYGWWSTVDADGTVHSCPRGAPLTYIKFGEPPASPHQWWSWLERYVQTLTVPVTNAPQAQRSERLAELWKHLGAERWRCIRSRLRS
ncbi:MAG: hypothetical protein ABI629_14925 [bacterium]